MTTKTIGTPGRKAAGSAGSKVAGSAGPKAAGKEARQAAGKEVRQAAGKPAREAAGKAAARRAYHHGALRQTLIDATEALLAERGPQGFSLREVARRCQVSPAAPAHHFGDAQGLLAAVATQAFDGLAAALQAGNERGGSDPLARMREQGVGYVGFALRHPGRFELMFRCGGYDDAALQASAQAAYRALEDGVRDLFGVPRGQALSPAQGQGLLSLWSIVHGFAHLALAGQFDEAAGAAGLDAFVRHTLTPMLQRQVEGLRATAAEAAPSRPGRRRKA